MADCIAIFRLGLDEVEGPMKDLSLEQQQMQRSNPFERYGMHWMLTIEKLPSSSSATKTSSNRKKALGNENSNQQAFDIVCCLWNLSVSLEGRPDLQTLYGEHYIKGAIKAGVMGDGQERKYDASRGIVCNLLGRPYPADWVRIKGGAVRFQLSAGRTVSQTATVSLYCPHTMETDGHCLGGFYINSWKGISGVVLKNHVYDSFRDGKSVQVRVGFIGIPIPCIKQEVPTSLNNKAENQTHVAVFRLGLDEVSGPLYNLSTADQRRQISRPFQRFGMHWMLSIERTTADSNDIEVSLWSLSLSLYGQNLASLGEHLKGEIRVGVDSSDGQDRRFNAGKGKVCNLLGRQYAADWIYMEEGVEFTLSAGRTLSEKKVVKPYCAETMKKCGVCYGGFYTAEWRGMAEIMLKNHRYDEFRDGKSCQVKVRFLGRPLAAVKPDRLGGAG